ncbi:serine/threonine-protein kinase [Patulibacter americanus]|uniref:serine/threonine-protein kinase n=1 Tax=Patulibacter americanus TaxID=588672 RepID=UPI0012FAB0BB|nr:serine/threonine-protein kinase [Patulibacter americanus]
MPALPRPGDRLAGFRIERELGRGTTGVVFLAHQEALDRRVALKVVGRPLADDEAFRARFRHEARTVAGLDHPNVVQILESGEDDDHLWLAMRYVDGPDLRVLLRRTGRLDPVQAVVVVEQVAAALDAAHAAGVVHRDVSPGNVLIEDGPGRDLHVELADFGLARAPGPEDPGGTPGYAAPEQLAGADATPAADVYGLGCVLYLLLTGVAPPAPPVPTMGGTGYDADPVGGAGARAAGPLRPSQALPRLGGAFDPAVERATDPDPARRFASAGELAIWARAALTVPRPAAGPAVAGPPAADVRAAAALPATPAEVGPTAVTWEAPPRRRRRTRWLLLPLAVLLLAALATAFVFIGRLGTGADDTDRRAGAPAAGTTTGAAGSTPLRTGTTGGGASSGRGATSGGGAAPGGATTSGGGAAPGGGLSSGGGASSGGGGSSGGRAGTGGAAASGAGPSTGGRGGSGAGLSDAGSGSGASRGSGAGTGSSAGSPVGGGAGAGGSGAGAGSSRATPSPGTAAPPSVGGSAPGAGAAAALPPVARGQVRFGGGFWSLDLPASEGWRQTSSTEQDGGSRIVTRLERPDRVRLLVEQLPGRTAVFGPAPGAGFAVRLPDAGRVTATLFRGGRWALCADACAAVPANGPSGGVLLIAGAHRADGARRLARRAASGLRVR